MKKNLPSAIFLLMSMGITLLYLFCQLPLDPTDPKRTNASIVFKNSDSSLSEALAIDSVRKQMSLGAALYLPGNFDSLNFRLTENNVITFDTTTYEFRDGYFYDTVWVRHSFLTPGTKILTLTPYSNPALSPVSAKITILGLASSNTAPHWSTDTLRKTIKPGEQVSQVLSEMCSDPENDQIAYSLVPGEIDKDTIIGTSYQFTPTAQSLGVFSAHVNATDPEGKSAVLPVKITVDTSTTLTYTVTYQKSSGVTGNVPIDTKKYAMGEQVTVLSNSNLVKSGFTFVGWNTKEDGSGTLYAAGVTLLLGTSDVVLYAQWSIKPTFTVTYNGNTNISGTVPVDSGSYQAGVTVTVKGNTGNMVKTGYTFAGWNTAADGSGAAYAESATFIMGSTNITLYARWTQKSIFTVTYNGNANTAGAAPVDPGKYESGVIVTVKDNTGNMVKVGLTFAGWNTTADGSGIVYAVGSTFTIQNDITFYAHWTTKPTFTVTYDGNGSTGGTVPSDANKYETAATVTVKDNAGLLVKTGSTFAGWNTAANGSGTTYTAGAAFPMGSANVTFYAQWTTKPVFTVTYDGNGNTGGTVPADANKYETAAVVTVKENAGALAKTGSTFAGWNTAADGNGTAYAAGVTFPMGSANMILYAQWTTKPTFTVTYDGNGNTSGTVPSDANKYETAAVVTVKENAGTLAKTGSTFAGWNTTANGSGTAYAAGVTFPMGSTNLTLYAQWTTKPTFTVTYDGNGNTSGTVPADANKYETAATVTVKDNTGSLVKTGSTFTGWNTAANGSGTAYATGATFPMGSANVTLYAQWTLKPTFTVSYNGNGNTGGTVPADANNYETAASVTVKTNTGSLVRTGFTFTGWNTAADGSGTVYSANATFPMGNTNVTLYAQWSLIPTFKVTYNGNGNTGGSVPSDTTKYQVAATVTVKGNTGTLVKTGATFSGWNTAADGSGAVYAVGATFPMGSANVTLYAQWTVNSYVVTYDDQSATTAVTPSSKIVTYPATTVGSLPAAPQKTGSTFGGWFTAQNGGGTEFSATTVVTANITVYAKWTILSYVVTYDDQSATTPVSPSSKTVTYPAITVGTLPAAPQKTGATFGGWYTAQNGSGTEFTAASTVSANMTVYAKWVINQYKVSFNSLGGTSITFQMVNHNSHATEPTPPTKASVTFWHWYSDQACTNQWNFSTGITSDITLYAKWVVMDVDGNIYDTVRIGTQTWMVQNLKTTKYYDGIDIPNVTNADSWANLSSAAYCWYENNTSNKATYGALYNWYAASNSRLAPAGWHLPSDDEWVELLWYLVDNGYNWDGTGELNRVGKSLATKTGWSSSTIEGEVGNNMPSNNKSGFSALPGGYRDGWVGSFYSVGNGAFWWTSTEYQSSNSDALSRSIIYDDATLRGFQNIKQVGNSVRCIKD
jgi:uncharacterized protein (TIGR02145 family)/uncharacterized repeat protein (TIGR02543 family)